jgi:hypothetical protein
MPAYNVGACGVEFAALEARFDGFRSKKSTPNLPPIALSLHDKSAEWMIFSVTMALRALRSPQSLHDLAGRN